MREEDKPDDRQDGFSDEDLRRLDVMVGAGAAGRLHRQGYEPRPGRKPRKRRKRREQRMSAGRRCRARERERRQRRRTVLAAVLGAAALSGGGGFVAWQAAAAAVPSAVGAMTIYLTALAFGGILLVASLMGGHDHADHHAGDHDPDHADDHDAGSVARAALVLPFLSLRFWVFGLAFFGLTGAILHGLRVDLAARGRGAGQRRGAGVRLRGRPPVSGARA